MAGRGTRLRPHTLTTPKPLIKIAGKTIVERLIEEISGVLDEKITEIAYIIGDFGKKVEDNLCQIAERFDAKSKIYHQQVALGTAHALYCAKDSLNDKVIVAFADTLFNADFKLNSEQDGIIWVHKVSNPEQFGVVKVDENNIIQEFIEKPKKFISDLAIIGIYYFKKANELRDEIQYLIDNKITVKGEYQLTDALENLKTKGTKFATGKVIEWLDCGNKNATVYTNQRVLERLKHKEELLHDTHELTRSLIVEPCFIDENVKITNSVIGPYVSIGKNTEIRNCIIKNSLIQEHTTIKNKVLNDSMIGNHVSVIGKKGLLSIGDYSVSE